MPDWVVRLVGLRTLDPHAPGVRFEFTHALSGGQWMLVGVLCALAAWFCYRRLEGKAWLRWVGASTRALALLLLAFLLTGPRFVEVQEHVEKDWVITLVDRSGSLAIADSKGAGGATTTRDAELRGLLDVSAPAWKEIDQQRVLKWLGFDAGTFELTAPDGRPLLGPPVGRRTDITGALEQALVKAAARPVSGIVLFSDGRSVTPVPRALVKRLQAEKIPVIVVPLGSSEALLDIAVASAVAPGTAFVNDPVPVVATITRTGTAAGGVTRVQLVDHKTGEALDEQTIDWATLPEGQTSHKVTLTSAPKDPGAVVWMVRAQPEGGADLVAGNNQAEVRVALVDRPLRLVYVDGYPRWEYRFLKNIMGREKSLKFSALLLSAGRRYLQEGSEEIDALPDTPSGWEPYDVIMLGDVQPGVLTPAQLEQIRTRVAVGGAGLIWIAGQAAVPNAYKGTPLGDLLPITPGAMADRLTTWDRDVVMKPMPLAEQLGVLRLAERQPDGTFWPAAVSDPSSGWSRLRWVQRLEPGVLKPAAEALAIASPIDGNGAPTPLVVTMRYGAGRVIYIATDEIWRYRFGRGEDLPERFYLQLIRLLGRESVARSGRAAIMQITPQHAEVGTPVRVSIDLIDQSLLEIQPGSLSVRLTRPGTGAEPGDKAELTLRPTGEVGKARSFVGTWIPSTTGTWSGVATDALLEGKDVAAGAEVYLPDDELRHPETDHALLRQLAQETGGAVVGQETIGKIGTLLPRREVRTVTAARQETIWDKPIMLAGLLVLLTLEWVVRKVLRLV